MPITKKLLAKDVAIVITPYTESGGVLSPATAFTVTGRAGTATVTLRNETERVESDDASGADRHWTKEDWTLVIEAVKLNTTAGDLMDKFTLYKYFSVAFTLSRGAGTRTETYTGIATEVSWNKQVGRNVDSMTIERVETGAANPAVS